MSFCSDCFVSYTLSSIYLFIMFFSRRYIFGGGFIGFRTNSKKRVTAMQGKADGYWSTDGANWVKINYGMCCFIFSRAETFSDFAFISF